MAHILAVSDVELPYIYTAVTRGTFKHIDFIISCGDLPFTYLEYILTLMDRNLYYVRGNHAPAIQGFKSEPEGAQNLHMNTFVTNDGILIAGIEGSLVYNYGPYQYTQAQMWAMVYQLVPKLMINYLRYGRFLDIFVTHAPPWKIHDQPDQAHQGVKAFRWLVESFQPKFHLHGHTSNYLSRQKMVTQLGKTTIIHINGYKEIEI